MTRLTMLLCAWLCAMALILAANPAQATGTNLFSYVSNTGSDSNGCTNPTTDACATFTRALAQTANYGEIDCVNGYIYTVPGGTQITQSVTIDCAGGVAQLQNDVAHTSFNIGAEGTVVRLRNLSFDGHGDGSLAISFSGGALYIENCVITNFNDAQGTNGGNYVGIEVAPSFTSQLFITKSIISNNGKGTGGGGISILAHGQTVSVSIDHSQITGNASGIVANPSTGGTIVVTVSDSVVSGNTTYGLTAENSGISALILVDQTEVAGNGTGLAASNSGAGIVVRNTSVFGNTTGLPSSSSGALVSYGNNSVNGNATNGTFTGTVGTE